MTIRMIPKRAQWLWGIGALAWAMAISPAIANCADSVGSREQYAPVISAHFRELQQTQDLPWSDLDIYDHIEDNKIFVTSTFDTLSGEHKTQIVDTLTRFDVRDYISAEEYEQGRGGWGIPPYTVLTSDGRELSYAYDGCTRPILLTEKARFEMNYTRFDRLSDDPLLLRNVGQSEWRQVNFPIEAANELAVRLGFWNSVGYENTDWWIAWVPETGHFEVNVPENFDYGRLQNYWQVADRSYRYVVVRTDGTQLGIKQF